MSYKKYSNYDFSQNNSNSNQNIKEQKLNVKIIVDLKPKNKTAHKIFNNFLFSKININKIPIKIFDLKKQNIKCRFYSLDKKCSSSNDSKELLLGNCLNYKDKKIKNKKNNNKPLNIKTRNNNNISIKNNYDKDFNRNKIYYFVTPKNMKNSEKRNSTNHTTYDRNNYIYYKKPLKDAFSNYNNNYVKNYTYKKSDKVIFVLNNSSENKNYFIKNIVKVIKIQSIWRGRYIRKLILKKINQYKQNIFLFVKILKRIFFYYKKILFQRFIFLLKYKGYFFPKIFNSNIKKNNINLCFSYSKKKIKDNCRCNSSKNKNKNLSCDNTKDYKNILNEEKNNIKNKLRKKEKYLVNNIVNTKNIKNEIYSKVIETENDKNIKIENIIKYINKRCFLINYPYFLYNLRIIYKEKEIENKFVSIFSTLESIRLKILKEYFYYYIKNKIRKKIDSKNQTINVYKYNDNRNNFINIINNNINSNKIEKLISCLETIYNKNISLYKLKESFNKIKNYINIKNNKRNIKLKFTKEKSKRNINEKKDKSLSNSTSKKTMKIIKREIKYNIKTLNNNNNNKIFIYNSYFGVKILLKLMDKIELKSQVYHCFKIWKKNQK